jgi:hypothetical protein
LILAGDILELALSNINVAAMVFEQFILQVMPKKSENRLFDKIVYIPGNHDHHLWEWARETQYRQFIEAHPDMEVLPIPWHKTRMFPRIPVPAGFLNTVIQRHNHLKHDSIDTVYPNCGLQNQDGSRLAVITHGHLIEPLYRAMSYLKEVILEKRMPNDIDGIESENFAWIDFFWSSLGRSGEAGRGVETIYEKMKNEEAFRKGLKKTARNLAEKEDLPGWGDWMEAGILNGIFQSMYGFLQQRERKTKAVQTETVKMALKKYISETVYNQFVEDRSRGGKEVDPQEVTFIFGHTHKPYSEISAVKPFPKWVNIYNTGGWVIEGTEIEPRYGAAVVLLDEELNSVALRMYNDGDAGFDFDRQVETADKNANPLFDRVHKLVKSNKALWNRFVGEAKIATEKRKEHFLDRIYGLHL